VLAACPVRMSAQVLPVGGKDVEHDEGGRGDGAVSRVVLVGGGQAAGRAARYAGAHAGPADRARSPPGRGSDSDRGERRCDAAANLDWVVTVTSIVRSCRSPHFSPLG
jgi:hypothetical protein